MLRRSKRNATKLTEKQKGRNRVIEHRRRLKDNEDLPDGYSTELDNTKVKYMSCSAQVYDVGSGEPVAEGDYTVSNSTHAEMNALVSYLSQGTDFTKIDRIEISSPPCVSCAFVLNLLGLLGKVKTTDYIKKNHTLSWRWPTELTSLKTLQDTGTFNKDLWDDIKTYFAGSNLDNKEILDEIIDVIANKADS